MTERSDRPQQLDSAAAQALAQALAAARHQGGDERALRDIISNRLRLKKAETLAVYQQFDAAWHAGVHAALHGGEAPPLEDDPFEHHAFQTGRGRTTKLIDAGTATGDASGEGASAKGAAPGASASGAEEVRSVAAMSEEDVAYYAALGRGHFAARSIVIALVVAALTWWLSGAAGAMLYAVAGAAALFSIALGLQAATVIEYLWQLVIVLVIALALAWTGFGDFFWPSLFGALAGMVDGIGRHETLRKRRLALAQLEKPT